MAKASWAIELETLDVMLQDRGYSQSKQHQHGDEPVLIRTCRDSRGELTLVFLSSEIKVGVRTLRKMRAEAQASGSRHVLLLSQEGLTPFAVRELAEQQDMDIEIFKKTELCTPILRHVLVPPHEPLSKQQKSELLARLGCKASALPKLRESDPVARYLHLSPGTVVAITRRIGSLEAEPYFRLVV